MAYIMVYAILHKGGNICMSNVILTIGGTILLGCLGAYVVNEVRKEYDDCVDENNSLRDFIRDHDFYEKQKPAAQACTASKQSSDKTEYQPSLVKIDEYVNEHGKTVGVY